MKLLSAVVCHLQRLEWRGVEQKLDQIPSLNHMQTASKQMSIQPTHAFIFTFSSLIAVVDIVAKWLPNISNDLESHFLIQVMAGFFSFIHFLKHFFSCDVHFKTLFARDQIFWVQIQNAQVEAFFFTSCFSS